MNMYSCCKCVWWKQTRFSSPRNTPSEFQPCYWVFLDPRSSVRPTAFSAQQKRQWPIYGQSERRIASRFFDRPSEGRTPVLKVGWGWCGFGDNILGLHGFLVLTSYVTFCSWSIMFFQVYLLSLLERRFWSEAFKTYSYLWNYYSVLYFGAILSSDALMNWVLTRKKWL